MVGRLVGVTAAALLLVACGGDDGETATATTSVASSTTASTTSEAVTSEPPETTAPPTSSSPTTVPPPSSSVPANDEVVDPSCLVGAADLAEAAGASETAVLTMLGEGWSATRDDAVLVDIDGFMYSCGDQDVFYGAWVRGEPEALAFVVSRHPTFTDPSGVGPGMAMSQAIASRGGSATVSSSAEGESREFLAFADGGAAGWTYRAASPSTGFAGIYPEDSGSFRTSMSFVDDAVVSEVWFNPGRAAQLATDASPSSEGLPVIARISALEFGDISCYALASPAIGGEPVSVASGFELCDRDDLLNTPVQLLYSVATVNDCESADACGQSRVEVLASGAVPLGESWSVIGNDTWTITLGQLDAWDGVNGTGDVTYHGCRTAELGDLNAACLTMTGGVVDCTDGVCSYSWANGAFSYSIVSEIEEDSFGPQRLIVRQDGEVILESGDLVDQLAPVG